MVVIGLANGRLNEMGYRVGQRALELIVWREKNSRRETRILGILQFIHTVVWKTLFGKPADSLEKSREHDDECTTALPCLLVPHPLHQSSFHSRTYPSPYSVLCFFALFILSFK